MKSKSELQKETWTTVTFGQASKTCNSEGTNECWKQNMFVEHNDC